MRLRLRTIVVMMVPIVFVSLAFLTGCAKGSATAPSGVSSANHAPTISSVELSPTFGIAGLTPFIVNGRASDEDGDALTFSWTVTNSSKAVIGTFTGPSIQPTISSSQWTQAIAHLSVSDGHGGSATRDSNPFDVGSMSDDWEVHSSAVPNVVLFYLRLTQDSAGGVAGIVYDKGDDRQLGRTDPAAQGRIDAAGNLTTLRVKFNSGADVTLSGRFQSRQEVEGIFSNATGTIFGRNLSGLPFTLFPD